MAAAAWAIGGAVLGGGIGFLGAQDQNKKADKQVDLKYKGDIANWKYNWQEAKAAAKYAQEGLEITKKNNLANIQFQEAQAWQQYNYQMGIQQYEFAQATKVYEASVANALQQQTFNELATNAANLEQDQLLQEQLITLELQEAESLFTYAAATAGVGLKKRQAKSAAVIEAQKARIESQKAIGASQARGVSGRSATKNVQGILAETGALQAAIVEEFLFNTDGASIDLLKLNQQFIADQVGYELSEQSAKLSDISAKNKIKAQALQAALNAANSIALKPELAPPIPKPLALPIPEYQDVYKPKKPPKPKKGVAMTQNPFLAGIGGALSGAQTGLSIGASYNAAKGTPWGPTTTYTKPGGN